MAPSDPPDRQPPRRPGRRNVRFRPPADDRPSPPATAPPDADALRVEVVDVSEPSLTLGRPLRHPFIIAAVTRPLPSPRPEEPDR